MMSKGVFVRKKTGGEKALGTWGACSRVLYTFIAPIWKMITCAAARRCSSNDKEM